MVTPLYETRRDRLQVLARQAAVDRLSLGFAAGDIAGQGLANPTALMQSARLMLAHLGERDAAVRLQRAIESVYREGSHLTRDVGGVAGTDEFTKAVIAKL